MTSPRIQVHTKRVKRKTKTFTKTAPVPKPAALNSCGCIPNAPGKKLKRKSLKKRPGKQRTGGEGSCATGNAVIPTGSAAGAEKFSRTIDSAHASSQTEPSTPYQLSSGKTLTDIRITVEPSPGSIQPDPDIRHKLDEALQMALNSKQSSSAPSPDFQQVQSRVTRQEVPLRQTLCDSATGMNQTQFSMVGSRPKPNVPPSQEGENSSLQSWLPAHQCKLAPREARGCLGSPGCAASDGPHERKQHLCEDTIISIWSSRQHHVEQHDEETALQEGANCGIHNHDQFPESTAFSYALTHNSIALNTLR